MRLIKLSTINNEASFTANFDTDIILKENAEIALKNVSFELARGEFAVTATTGTVDAFPCVEDGTQSFNSIIEDKIYDEGDGAILLRKLNNALNRIVTIANSHDNTQKDVGIFGMYLVYKTDLGAVNIQFRLAPQINALEETYAAETGVVGSGQYMIEPFHSLFNATNGTCFTRGGFNGRNNELIGLSTSYPPLNSHRYRLVTPHGVGLSKGGGCFWCQISKSVVKADVDTNGFGIGLALHRVKSEFKGGSATGDAEDSSDPRLPVQTLTDTFRMPPFSRCMEIEYRDANNNYRFINKGMFESEGDNSFEDAGFSSAIQGLNDKDNDIILFEIDCGARKNEKVIRGSVIQMVLGVASKRQLFERTLTEEEQDIFSMVAPDYDGGVDLVPYIYFRGTTDNIQLKHIRFTPNPFIAPGQFGGDFSFLGSDGTNFEEFAFPIEDDDPRVGGGALNTSAVAAALPELDVTNGLGTRFQEALDTPNTSRIKLRSGLNNILGNALGKRKGPFDETVTFKLSDFGSMKFGTGVTEPTFGVCKALWEFNVGMMFNFDDIYLVETKSLELDSYDSSALTGFDRQGNPIKNTKGERKNILATILHGGIESLVQHEPNEMNFISIRNSNNLNLRNLNLRIVNDEFKVIGVDGTSHITLLVKD